MIIGPPNATLIPSPIARSGKPINQYDYVTVIGTVTGVTGSGPTAVVAVTLAGSLASVNVEAQDLRGAQQYNTGPGPANAVPPTGGVNVDASSVPLASTAYPFVPGTQVTFEAQVESFTGYGPTASLTVTLINSLGSISVEAQDVAASTQTL